MSLQFVTPSRRRTLWTLATQVVPPCADLEQPARDEMMRLIDVAVTQRSATMQRQLGLFLRVIRLAAIVRGLRKLENLPPERLASLLSWLERNPIGLVRKGFWGVKALILMGYYGQGPIKDALGYLPKLTGGGLQSTMDD